MLAIIMKSYTISNLLLWVIVIVCLVCAWLKLPYNLDSIYDEGFLFLNQQSAFKGEILGISQGTNIIAAFFSENICATILGMRRVGYVLTIFCSILFSLIVFPLFGKSLKSIIQTLLLSFLFASLSIPNIALCQNGLAQFFFCIALAMGCRVLIDDTKWNYLWCVGTGGCLIFGMFCILPGAILLSLSLLILLVIKYWHAKRKLLNYVICTILGFIFGLGIMHLFVADLLDVIIAMKQTAANVTTLNRGYDPINFVTKIALFMRDWFMCGIVIVGCISLAELIKKMCGYKWLSGILLMIALLVYFYYQKNPRVTIPMFMSVMWIACLFYSFEGKTDIKIDCDSITNLFLVLSPIILSLGTNTYLGGKMSFFMLPWVILLLRLGWQKNEISYQNEIMIVIFVLLLIQNFNVIKLLSNQQEKVDSGPLAGMHLTEQQSKHFHLCKELMNRYGFEPKKSVVYSNQLGMMTICYMNGISCANYFQPMDFVTHANKDNLLYPDFLFLSEFDIQISSEKLLEMGWGWPNEFDVYDVNSPETYETGYSTKRKLYCRKSLKIND